MARWDFINEKSSLFYYWLGWMISDGCIFAVSKNSAFIDLGLHSDDVHILEFFKRKNECTARILKQNGKNMHKSRTFIPHEYINILSEWGFVPNKTENFKVTDRLMSLKEEDFYQFLVGFIEGDGSVDCRTMTKKVKFKTTKTKYYQSSVCRIRMIGVEPVLSFIKSKLIEFGFTARKMSPKKNNKAFEYTISGKDAIILFGKLLSSEYHLLERKWSKLSHV